MHPCVYAFHDRNIRVRHETRSLYLGRILRIHYRETGLLLSVHTNYGEVTYMLMPHLLFDPKVSGSDGLDPVGFLIFVGRHGREDLSNEDSELCKSQHTNRERR